MYIEYSSRDDYKINGVSFLSLYFMTFSCWSDVKEKVRKKVALRITFLLGDGFTRNVYVFTMSNTQPLVGPRDTGTVVKSPM